MCLVNNAVGVVLTAIHTGASLLIGSRYIRNGAGNLPHFLQTYGAACSSRVFVSAVCGWPIRVGVISIDSVPPGCRAVFAELPLSSFSSFTAHVSIPTLSYRYGLYNYGLYRYGTYGCALHVNIHMPFFVESDRHIDLG